MYFLRVLAFFLALGGSLTLVACGGQPVRAQCFGPRPVSSVYPVGDSMSFAMTTIYGTVTYSVPKSAFGGAPAAMKNGDIVAFCAETVDSTTTITQFSDQGQPVATGTPPSR
jgi:uncharacterized Zn-binding protein involved in type VI secretion